MATDNIKLVQAVYAAFKQRDLAVLGKLLAPNIRIRQSALLPWGGEYEGASEFPKFFSKLVEHIDSNVSFDQLIDAGEHVVAIGRTSGTVLKNGATFDVPVVHVWGAQDGKVVSLEPYIDVPLMKKSLDA